MEKLELKLVEDLKEKQRGVSIDEIFAEFGDEYDINTINQAILVLETEGKIFRNKKNKFIIWNNSLRRMIGTLHVTQKGTGILKTDDGKVSLVHKHALNGAINGDRVIVNELKEVKKHLEGKVERILDRPHTDILCEVTSDGKKLKLISINEKQTYEVKIPKEDLAKCSEGDRLLVKIGLDMIGDAYTGKVIRKVCHRNDPESDLISIAATYGFDVNFPDEVKEEVKKIPIKITEDDLTDRVDLRDKTIFTIDCEDTKDIDDAISLEKLPNGNYKLSVHIADVAHYVKPGTALFREALKRGTSVYMVNSVIPMLPRELSNGICSLNPDTDRLTKTCEMEINPNGRIISKNIYNSIIRSRKKMTYNAVNDILVNNQIPEGYEEFVDDLNNMQELSKILTKKSHIRGAFEINKPETKIKTDNKGRPYEITCGKRGPAEDLIENFMLAANETVAHTYHQKKVPFIYRIHERPDYEKLSEVINKICCVNLQITRPNGDITAAKTIQKFMNSLKDYREYPAFVNMILRGVSKAKYSEANVGHHGLALKNYTHFTSPIRRFPDLLVHTLIDLYNKKELDDINMEELNERITEAAFLSSASEIAAQRAEYDALDMKAAEYMNNHIGEVYEATVTEIDENGMRVMLDNVVEGMVHISDTEPKAFLKFNPNRYSLESDDINYYLGDRIYVKVKKANKERRHINFIANGHVKNKSRFEKMKTKELNSRQNPKNSV